jgi:hypothetical protein
MRCDVRDVSGVETHETITTRRVSEGFGDIHVNRHNSIPHSRIGFAGQPHVAPSPSIFCGYNVV